ncbi:MAG: hypothetical protein V7707_14945 [Motiliproteus sp.]
MRLFNTLSIALLTTCLSLTAQADSHAADDAMHADQKPAIMSARTIKVVAMVEAIDHKSREVTLKKENGELVSFTADEEVRNLDQVSVGDTVSTEYQQQLSVEVLAAKDAVPAYAEIEAMERAKKGEMPGMKAVEVQIEVSTVTAIDLENNRFTLQTADGMQNEYEAASADNLKRAAVGDIVVVTLTQTMAISVEKK